MTFRHALVCLVLVSFAVPSLPAQDAPRQKEKKTELESKMDKVSSAWRKLRRQISDPAQNESSLELVAAIRGAVAGAEKLTPAKESDVPESDRAKFQADYEASMKKFEGMLESLENALKAGDNDNAETILNDINNFQRESHKSFRRPPPERPHGEGTRHSEG